MKTQYLKMNTYDGNGEFLIIFDDAAKFNPYRVMHKTRDYYGGEHCRIIEKYGDMKSAVLCIYAQLDE